MMADWSHAVGCEERSSMAKRLYRSREDRRIWGVAGGLAHYLDFDPVLVRIGFVVLACASGPGVLAYILMAIFVPNQPETTTASQEPDASS
jgi:phage shock protein C